MNHKIAIVTGASRGLGRNAALRLASRGVDIIITYHSKRDEAEKVVAEIEAAGAKAAALQLDVSQSKSFTQFAVGVKAILQSKWQRNNFDYLVNNAGTGINIPFIETSEEQFDQMMNVHLKGVYFLTQKLVGLMADGGSILNISSGLARFSFPGYSAYAVMKGAVEVLSRYLAKELGARGIRVNTLAPGAIATDFGGGAVRDNQELNQHIASLTALGRVGLPDDIGGVIASMLSDDNRWVNGQRIEAAGGIFL
ncbi:short-chain dehydrogenase [Cellvibrio zantedeschiae]|uniref:Short-chain dehydrogenase n=1 Tax=Cellvibrio zantedeschiae TaxID=1237077 RepID=A0ABQ3AS34_9GAMM|nr:SDR family oxidoreductase [Cellvibrio zantedeschiae]GGY62321.1 short-chain dehydrogenase [Cellvibrio zantedeschiae]